ncbi:MAG: arsenate reductase ArsC [Pyrinomonadaceae bacterium]
MFYWAAQFAGALAGVAFGQRDVRSAALLCFAKGADLRNEAVEAMREVGIDISSHRSKSVYEFTGQEFYYVITVCDNAAENCPLFPGKAERIHWSFEDPAAVESSEEQRLDTFRRVRDQISDRLLSWTGSASR